MCSVAASAAGASGKRRRRLIFARPFVCNYLSALFRAEMPHSCIFMCFVHKSKRLWSLAFLTMPRIGRPNIPKPYTSGAQHGPAIYIYIFFSTAFQAQRHCMFFRETVGSMDQRESAQTIRIPAAGRLGALARCRRIRGGDGDTCDVKKAV